MPGGQFQKTLISTLVDIRIIMETELDHDSDIILKLTNLTQLDDVQCYHPCQRDVTLIQVDDQPDWSHSFLVNTLEKSRPYLHQIIVQSNQQTDLLLKSDYYLLDIKYYCIDFGIYISGEYYFCFSDTISNFLIKLNTTGFAISVLPDMNLTFSFYSYRRQSNFQLHGTFHMGSCFSFRRVWLHKIHSASWNFNIIPSTRNDLKLQISKVYIFYECYIAKCFSFEFFADDTVAEDWVTHPLYLIRDLITLTYTYSKLYPPVVNISNEQCTEYGTSRRQTSLYDCEYYSTKQTFECFGNMTFKFSVNYSFDGNNISCFAAVNNLNMNAFGSYLLTPNPDLSRATEMIHFNNMVNHAASAVYNVMFSIVGIWNKLTGHVGMHQYSWTRISTDSHILQTRLLFDYYEEVQYEIHGLTDDQMFGITNHKDIQVLNTFCHGPSCYILFTNSAPITMSEAEVKCQAIDGHLVSINHRTEWYLIIKNFIHRRMYGRTLIIGLKKDCQVSKHIYFLFWVTAKKHESQQVKCLLTPGAAYNMQSYIHSISLPNNNPSSRPHEAMTNVMQCPLLQNVYRRKYSQFHSLSSQVNKEKIGVIECLQPSQKHELGDISSDTEVFLCSLSFTSMQKGEGEMILIMRCFNHAL